MSIMASPVSGGGEQPLWLSLLLGIVFIIAGIFVLGDVMLASVVSAFLIGIFAIIGGAFEIIHAFWTKGWGGFIWQILLGLLYIAAGVTLVSEPVNGALILTWLIAVFLIVSGVMRLFLGGRVWSDGGWLLVISGIFAVLAGIVILSGWPATGLWVIGFLIGIDLIIHGIGWLIFAFAPSARMSPA